MAAEIKVKLSSLRMSPRKVRLAADLARGRKATKAMEILSLLPKKAAQPLLKLLKSAVANAKHNHNLAVEDLRVAKLTVNQGQVLKRWLPRAHGRATVLRNRTSHIELVLALIKKK